MAITIPWQVKIGSIFLCCSFIVYTIKLLLIDNVSGTIEYIFNSFGFLFLNVLMVTLVINGLLTMRTKKDRLEKLNIVISVFFSDTGSSLLALLIPADKNISTLSEMLTLKKGQKPDVAGMLQAADAYLFSLDNDLIPFEILANFLRSRRDFFLRLLENPVMLENQTFTDLLQATFHLSDEISRRSDLGMLTTADSKHLAIDVSRVYQGLTLEWIRYMGYLYRTYPHLYSLALRTNPFDPNAKVEILE